mmetsp:Transcript_25764/g.62309  ORF Transcript_25764/g.62309 Transcript_25764/m.62309 type:complete len:290 (-) Transcript_25764:942-1811(-)
MGHRLSNWFHRQKKWRLLRAVCSPRVAVPDSRPQAHMQQTVLQAAIHWRRTSIRMMPVLSTAAQGYHRPQRRRQRGSGQRCCPLGSPVPVPRWRDKPRRMRRRPSPLFTHMAARCRHRNVKRALAKIVTRRQPQGLQRRSLALCCVLRCLCSVLARRLHRGMDPPHHRVGVCHCTICSEVGKLGPRRWQDAQRPVRGSALRSAHLTATLPRKAGPPMLAPPSVGGRQQAGRPGRLWSQSVPAAGSAMGSPRPFLLCLFRNTTVRRWQREWRACHQTMICTAAARFGAER